MSDVKSHLVCIGFGYVAQALAATLDPARWRVSGTIRTQRAETSSASLALVPFAGATPAIMDATHILISVPPDSEGDPTLRAYGAILDHLPELRWLGYLSTTGVYGDTGGVLVDETAPLAANAERSRRRVAAERDWQALAARGNLPLHIFRLAGIYGPGRSPLDQVRAGTARRITKPGHAFSRIHVDDIARALTLSMARPRPGAIYNLCDDEASEQSDVIAYAHRLLGMEPPRPIAFAKAAPTMSAMQRSFWDDNRRIDNSRVKSELGLVLKYPTYRDGLDALVNRPAATSRRP